MCFNVPHLPHETHAVPARVVQKVPNHLRLSRILVFGGRHDLGRGWGGVGWVGGVHDVGDGVGWGGVGGLTTLMCGGVHVDGDGVEDMSTMVWALSPLTGQMT